MDEVPGEVERLKWVGIYPQKQGGDAFMMRIKILGGVLTPEQTKVIGKIAADFAHGPIPNPHFGNNFLDLTTRQDVQMHWLKMENIPEIWRRLEEVGITTVQACGDSARNVLCCPVSGLDQHEVIDAFPVARAISAYFTGNREYANLPRKFKMSVTGCLEDCAQAEINDVGMLPARLEEGTLGFNLRTGGGLSTAPGWPRTSTSSSGRGGGDHPRHSPGLRRARGQREPLDRENALPGPGTRPRELPRRTGEARLGRPHAGRRGSDEEIPRRPRRRPPPT